MATQLSVIGTSKVRLMYKDEFYNTSIGSFIDKVLLENKENVTDLGNNSVVLDLTNVCKIVGVSDDEKTSWKQISQISRHPANGGLVKITTQSGKTTTCTLSHSFLKRSSEQKIVPVLGSDLKLGDRLPVAMNIQTLDKTIDCIKIGDLNYKLSRDLGWLFGAYLADGNTNYHEISITKVIPEYQQNIIRIVNDIFTTECRIKMRKLNGRQNILNGYDMNKYNSEQVVFKHKGLAKLLNQWGDAYTKTVPGWIYNANIEFIQGFIGGYFDGDGNVDVNSKKCKEMVRAHSASEELIDDMIVLLAFCGIFASKCKEARKKENRVDLWSIQIARRFGTHFKDKIGFIVKEKSRGLDNLIENIKSRKPQDCIDMIPELSKILHNLSKSLGHKKLRQVSRDMMKQNSSIGRQILKKHYKELTDMYRENALEHKSNIDIETNLSYLKQAIESDVVWDKIVKIEYLPDPQEYVYDFTVPGNDSFMIDTGILVHNTLNTFHLSGVSAASKTVRGVPRLKELLGVSKKMKTPSMKIYFDDTIKYDQDACVNALNQIRIVRFKDIVKCSEIYFDPNDSLANDLPFTESYKKFTRSDKCFQNLSPWVLRMILDEELIFTTYGIRMIELSTKLSEWYNDKISCIFTDDNAKGNFIFRIKLTKDNNEDINTDDMLTELKALEHNILENIIIRGIPNIEGGSIFTDDNKRKPIDYNKDTKTFENKNEWFIVSDGTNLEKVLGIPYIDKKRTITNNIVEIYERLGIEAVRQALFNEINEVLGDSVHVDYRHIAMLVDVQTNKGYILSIDRHGINRGDIGPLAKCSFEETTDKLIKAGVFAENDKINGVSANVMLGQIAPAGTGDCEILIDQSKLININANYIGRNNDDDFNIDECAPENFKIVFHSPIINKTKKTIKIKNI